MAGNPSSARKPRREAEKGKSPTDVQAELTQLRAALRKERERAKRANAEIVEALEQQAATSEILRAIAESPTDVQPVLNVIVENARRLCNASMSEVYRADGTTVYSVATSDVSEDVLETAREVSSQSYPAPLRWDSTLSSRAILSRAVVHVPDMEHAPDLPDITRRYVRAGILNSVLQVPMMCEGAAIGAIGVGKRDPAPFTEKQIALLQTFASQAVIAIENARLFSELQTRNREITQALELQTATSEILQVIASSPTDIRPVMQVIAERAVKLCDGLYCGVYQTDGTTIDQMTEANFTPAAIEESRRAYPRPLDRAAGLSSRAILDRKVINVPDIFGDPDIPELTKRYASALGMNSILFVPLMRDQEAIGSIGVGRSEKGLFPEKNIALLQTFASQAVIAIENVRLFNELQQSNAEITESLEYQTAVSEILRVIAASPADIQPVLDAISENALKLCGANFSAVYNYDGKMLDMTALKNFTPQATAEIQREYPRPLTRDGGYSARSILDKKVVHVIDALNDPDIPEATRPLVASLGFRSGLWVPMVREGNAIGAFCVARPEAGAFDEKKIKLLQTFADQATIAIENVRLFTETQRLLKETEQRAAELAIINSVQEGLASKLDVQAIYDLVGDKIRDIFHATGTAIYLFDQEQEIQYTPYCFLKQRFTIEPHPYSDIAKTMMESPRPRLYRNLEEYRALGGAVLESGEEFKSGMNVPLMVGKEIKGMIHVANLDKANAYGDSDLRLLTTLANSMSVALENARLFDETQRLFKEAREARAAAEHANQAKSAFLANMSHELRTPLNAIMGFTRIVRRKGAGLLPRPQIENLDKVLDSSEHLLHLINTVLDIAKIEAGRMDVQAADFNASALMDLCASTAAPLVKPPVRLVKQTDDLGVVYSDQDKIKQIILNLLSNAAKFTMDGEIALKARKENETLIVDVCDTGIGITAEALGRVFDEFQQADTSTTRQYGGTGLGLTISRDLARLLGGDLTAQSEYGKGSTFTLAVPIRYEPKPASPSDLAPDSAPPAESTPEAESN